MAGWPGDNKITGRPTNLPVVCSLGSFVGGYYRRRNFFGSTTHMVNSPMNAAAAISASIGPPSSQSLYPILRTGVTDRLPCCYIFVNSFRIPALIRIACRRRPPPWEPAKIPAGPTTPNCSATGPWTGTNRHLVHLRAGEQGIDAAPGGRVQFSYGDVWWWETGMRQQEFSVSQWRRKEHSLPGRPGHVSLTASDNRSSVNGVLWLLHI